MKLFYSQTSPFARKVLACAIARGIDGQIKLEPTVTSSPELAKHNPLGKLPCLVTDDGVSLYDSRVICAFLDTVGDGFSMFPEHGLRVRALKYQALGDGIMDAAVLRRNEMARGRDPDRDVAIAEQALKMSRAVAALEADVPAAHVDIGTIAVCCALGYLDFRYAHEPWRDGHPLLAAWYADMVTRPCLALTAPEAVTATASV
jgi:glutathione S-transferase